MLLIFRQMIFMQEILPFDNYYVEIVVPVKITHAIDKVKWESTYRNLNYE